MNDTKKLQAHSEALSPILRWRAPVRFDDSTVSKERKSEIQTWNRQALALLKSTPGAQGNADLFQGLGRMSYETPPEVRVQLKARQQVLDQFLAGPVITSKSVPREAKPVPEAPARAVSLSSKATRPAQFKYDICLSFAGEDRPYVQQVYDAMTAARIEVFYDFDADITAALWGENLYVYLDEIYRTQARYCVMFLSKDYARKLWTNHERESAQARAFTDNKAYILPIRLDDTVIPGIRPTQGFFPKSVGIPTIVASALRKLGRPAPAPVKGRKAKAAVTPGTRKATPAGLKGHIVLLGDRLYLAQQLSHRQGQGREIELRVRSEGDRTALRALAGSRSGEIRFVDREDVFQVRADLINETTRAGRTTMTLKLTSEQSPGMGVRMGVYGRDLGELAERRLRQLLLGEAPVEDSAGFAFSTRFDLPPEVKSGVIAQARQLTRSPAEALQMAPLIARFYIRSLDLIDTVSELRFKPGTGGKVQVTFELQRETIAAARQPSWCHDGQLRGFSRERLLDAVNLDALGRPTQQRRVTA